MIETWFGEHSAERAEGHNQDIDGSIDYNQFQARLTALKNPANIRL